jgi:hypothetical protein
VTATISMSVFTGTNAGTEHTGQSSASLTDADAVSGGNVLPGSVSYERWVALRCDSAPTHGATNFYVICTGSLPTGVTIKFGVTDTGATPKNTVSTVATMDLTAGRKFIFDTGVMDGVGEHTRYLVLQEVVALGAPSGAISPQALTFGWAEA